MSIIDINSPAEQYGVIYADPPWSYQQKGHGAACKHYPTMTPEEIKALPVANLAQENSVLFLWATFPNLPQALDVIEAWGFTYKTLAFCWVKQNKRQGGLFWGLGSYTRQNAEVCLLAVKGRPKVISHSVHSVIQTPIERHSKKPDEARHRIEQLMGEQKRLELFARQTAPGWDCWGNEVNE